MNTPQKIQLIRSNRDAIMDVTSLAAFSVMIYFVLNPDKYDKITQAAQERLNKLTHTLSVWQTKLAIRSLPETDHDEQS